MAKLPLCSSGQLVAVLKRAGFSPKKQSGRKKKGSSHQTWIKEVPSGEMIVTVVVLGKKEIRRGTLKDILKQAEIPHDEFLRLPK